MPGEIVQKGEAPSTVIVAVTASGAVTASLERLLTELPVQEHMAVIVAVQYREALDESKLRQALAQAGRELVTVEDGAAIGRGRIYLPRANDIVMIEQGRLRTRTAEQPPGSRGVIDSLLVSLARDEDGRTVLVALAGTDGDGTLGVKAVKEAGGLALAEQTEAGDLGSSDKPAALADAVLPLPLLIDRLAAHIGRLAAGKPASDSDPEMPEVATALAALATILRNKTGHDFHGYKPGTFLRRVQRRMQVVQTDSMQQYIEILRGRPDEPQNLFNDLLIGVTQFFRDGWEFDLLDREVIPKLFEGKSRSDQLRVWVVGCATGEEAYSLAILLRERAAVLDDAPQIQIFATDLDGRALAAARAGRYANTIVEAMTPERLARWFVREGDTYCVTKELREMCIFSQHSIIKDAPFSRLDLVSCRNLLIYLGVELQSRVIPLFHFALKPGGFLFLGNSENIARHTDLFAPVENRSRVFRRLDTGRVVLPSFPFTAVDRRFIAPAQPTPEERARPAEGLLTRRAERFAERYAPAYVIADESYTVLHFSGRMGRFIDPAGGAASLNLLQLIHPDLRLELRTALAQAAEQKRTVQAGSLRMGLNGDQLVVDLVVEPVQNAPDALPTYFVLFKDGAILPDSGQAEAARARSDHTEHVQRLEAELRTSKERLQATVEELESTNEELKSSNEEYQSLNEELQSANEELETSKEELQSVNEELTTVNGELAHRVQELTRVTSDLRNFLESNQIATIFLDNELRVTNFTPAVSDLFHIVDSDVGRPVGHIKARIAYDELQEDARRVLRTLGTLEREATNAADGARYLVRVLPYRSMDNIAGVVLTFVDITERQRAEEARRESEERFRAIVESARDYAIFITDPSGTIQEWLPGAAAIFGWRPEEVVGRDGAIVYTQEDLAGDVFQQELATARRDGFASYVRWHQRKDGSRVFIEGSARVLRDASGRPRAILKIGQDMTERRRNEESLLESEARAKLLLAELQHRVRNTLAVVRTIAQRTADTSKTVEDYVANFNGRITAFARVQAAVTRDPVGGVDLEQIVASELVAHVGRDGDAAKSIGGPKVLLSAKAAETLALAIHELAVNAIKHGSLSDPDGRVQVIWRIEDGAPGTVPSLALEWTETGVTLSGEPPSRQGFGTELLDRILAYELGATTSLRFEASGLRFSLVLPLTDRIVTEQVYGNINTNMIDSSLLQSDDTGREGPS